MCDLLLSTEIQAGRRKKEWSLIDYLDGRPASLYVYGNLLTSADAVSAGDRYERMNIRFHQPRRFQGISAVVEQR
jgi:hypothetical protein